MRIRYIVSIILLLLVSCKENNVKVQEGVVNVYECPMHCEGNKMYEEAGVCPVCEMDLKLVQGDSVKETASVKISEMSIFNLNSRWTNQNGQDLHLKDLQGEVLVMVMIYTSCKAACPRLVADMRNIEKRLTAEAKERVKMIFVSIDPEIDTPERLKVFAKENYMDADPWMFLRSTEENTREFAAVVAVSYKEISPIDFSHSNIITVFDQHGEMVFQQEGLGVNSDQTVKHINDAVLKLKKEL
ncbi:protein SCO1/2 [Zhouia amylolytica]|nr:SCO family protein [Zhouia amylolytica]SFT07491.1 protein SCO1/2 [Zhouia amylolytica]